MNRFKFLLCGLLLGFSISSQCQVNTFIKPDQIKNTTRIGAVNIFQDSLTGKLNVVYGISTLSSYKAEYATYSSVGELILNQKLSNPYYNPDPREFLMSKNNELVLFGYANLSDGYPINYTAFYDTNLNEVKTIGKDTSFNNLTEFSDSTIAAITEFHDSTTNGPKSDFGISLLNWKGELSWTTTIRSILGLSLSDSLKYYIGSLDTYNDTIYALINSKTEVNMLVKIDENGNHFYTDSIGFGTAAYSIDVAKTGIILTYSYGTYPNYTVTIEHQDWNKHISWVYKGEDSTRFRVGLMDAIVEGDKITFISRMVHLDSQSPIQSHSSLTQLSTIDGETIFVKEYIDSAKSFVMQSLTRANDGGFLMTGVIVENSPWISYLFKTDSIGNIYESDIGTTFPSTMAPEISEKPKFSVYPIPTGSTLKITYSFNGIISNRLVDLSGVVMHSDQMQGTTTIDVSGYPNGIYFLQIQGEGILETRKIIISH